MIAREPCPYAEPDWFRIGPQSDSIIFEDVRGMNGTVDAVVGAIADAGPSGSIVLMGPPNTGATMIARRIPSILPDPTVAELAQIRAEFDGVGMSLDHVRSCLRPFRAPHHTISRAALMGGPITGRFWTGPKSYRTERYDRAGEYHLARHGVLFLDELPEFRRDVLEGLAERRKFAPPAPLIIATAAPCPCGWHGYAHPKIPGDPCACTPEARERWSARIAAAARLIGTHGPRIEIPLVDGTMRERYQPGRTTAELRERVARAWGRR